MPLSNIAMYHRPATLEDALHLLREGRGNTVPLAGGTTLVGDPPPEVEGVVDLRDLRLDWIIPQQDGSLFLGATTTLQALLEADAVRAYADGAVADAARYEAGSLVRQRATLGGTLVARAASSDLVALLLALGAEVVLQNGGETMAPLDDFYRRRAYLLQPGSLLTEVRLPALPEGATVRQARIARTPMDQPILALAALQSSEGTRVGVAGAGPEPLLLQLEEGGDEALDAAARTVTARGDHLATAAYRQAMMRVLLRRVAGQE